jgi:hypothetical protein
LTPRLTDRLTVSRNVTLTLNFGGLMQLQKDIKGVVKENSEFRNTRNGTRVITKTLAYFAAFKSHQTNNLL